MVVGSRRALRTTLIMGDDTLELEFTLLILLGNNSGGSLILGIGGNLGLRPKGILLQVLFPCLLGQRVRAWTTLLRQMMVVVAEVFERRLLLPPIAHPRGFQRLVLGVRVANGLFHILLGISS